MYTSVKASLDAIRHAEKLVDPARRHFDNPLQPAQLRQQLGLALDKIMAEGSLYDPELASLALQQAEGDVIEAAFLLRAYRSTLPRVGYSLPASGDEMRLLRRISATYQDVPGGQLLGRTRDYTLRLLSFASEPETPETPETKEPEEPAEAEPHDGEFPAEFPGKFPSVVANLRREGYLPPEPPPPTNEEPFDVTREPLRFPAPRSARLQVLARGEAGAILSLAYGAMRGFGAAHAYVSEMRQGELPVYIAHPVTGRKARLGWLPASEAHVIFPGKASLREGGVDFSFGYGITVGRDERKAIAMGVVDENLSQGSGDSGSGDAKEANVRDEEFVLHHVDCVEASGFVEHLKLPHYVTFQADKQRSDRVADLLKQAGQHD